MGSPELSSRRREESFELRLRSGDHLGGADGLQRGDGLGHEGRLLFDDGVIDGSAEAFVEDFDAEQFGGSGGAVFVGAGDGDIEGQDLVGIPGKSWPDEEMFFGWGGPRPSLLLTGGNEYVSIEYMSIQKGGNLHVPMTPQKGIKRMNLNVPSDVHLAFKLATASEDKEMTEVLLEFIHQYIAEHPAAARLAKKGGRP